MGLQRGGLSNPSIVAFPSSSLLPSPPPSLSLAASFASWRQGVGLMGIRMFSQGFDGFRRDLPIKVLVGTQTGTAMGFARNFEEAGIQRGLGANGEAGNAGLEVIDLDDYDPTLLGTSPEHSQVILIMACYGAGEPTDNAKKFYQSIMNPNLTSLPSLSFAVFGLGSSKTHKQNYNVIAKTIDARLTSIGAKRVFKLGLGDDSAWFPSFLLILYLIFQYAFIIFII